MSSPPSTEAASDELSASLKTILTRPSPFDLLPADLTRILSAFLNQTPQPRTLALAIFARSLTPTASSTTLSTIQEAIQFRLSGTDSRELIEALSCLSAILQVAPHLAVDLLKDGPIRTNLEDAMLLISTPRVKASAEESRVKEQRALVELLALAAGQGKIRAVIRASAGEWLESLLGLPGVKGPQGTKDGQARAMAALAVVKLRLGTEKPEDGGQVPSPEAEKEKKPSLWTLTELTKLFVEVVATSGPATSGEGDTEARESTLSASLEALAYLTLVPDPSLKELLVSSNAFLSSFFSLLSGESSPLTYAVGSLLANLVSFPPAEDAESDAAQIARLKAFAEAKKKAGQPATEPAKAESSASVTKRIERLVRHTPSPIPTVQQLAKSTSVATRRLAGKILLALVTPAALRGQLLQEGSAKLLLSLARQIPAPFSPAQDLDPIQALAKLLITTNPLLVLGPTPQSPALLEAVSVIALGLSPAEDERVPLLVTFECLMALTNISSLDPDLAGRIAASKVGKTGLARDGGEAMLAVVEELMLSGNTMVRRAATELMCNLVCSQAGFDYYEPAPLPKEPKKEGKGVEPSSRLHLLLALASSPDLATRLAASGALTSIAMSPTIGLALAVYPRGLEIILALLVSADENLDAQSELGLRHRGLDALRSLALAVSQSNEAVWRKEAIRIAEEAKVRGILTLVVKSEVDAMVKEAGMEALDAWASL